MKFFNLLLIMLFILLYSCNSKDSGYIKFKKTKNEFTLEGTIKLEDSITINAQRFYIPDYSGSYVEISPNLKSIDSYTFKVLITFPDYNLNKTTQNEVEWGNLPGGRNLPGVSGGSGVGNGLLPMRETFWSYGPIRVFQRKDLFGVFISIPMSTRFDGMILTRRMTSRGQRMNASFVGKIRDEDYGDGILILLDKVKEK